MTEPTEGAAVTATPARDALIPAYLGWSNGPDRAGLRLYATDRQEATGPRWDSAFFGGRVVEYAATERGGTEGDAYVVIRVGDRRASARENPAGAVVAALVESGWRPTADQLRAMGGEPATLTNVEWPLDLGTCPYNQRGKAGADPNGTCSFGCYDEPECQTCRPREGWPSDRGEIPEPWVYTAEPMALPHPEGHDVTVWAFPEGVDGD